MEDIHFVLSPILTPMNAKILKLARKKLTGLRKKYDRFINVIVDDWRGYRFIFDTKDVRQCRNDCENCPLYKLLKNERNGYFSANLYPSGKKDKKLFGSQNFLNCKTLRQYENCYVNFLIKKANTDREIKNEIRFIKGLRIIFANSGNAKFMEKKFRKDIFKKATGTRYLG